MPMLIQPNKYFNVETFPDDKDYRAYHCRMRLLDSGLQTIEAYKGAEYLSAGVDLPSMMEFAFEIEGVTWCRLASHALMVRKSPLYEWEEIDKKLVPLLLSCRQIIDDLEEANGK